jgi:hypothetical protein
VAAGLDRLRVDACQSATAAWDALAAALLAAMKGNAGKKQPVAGVEISAGLAPDVLALVLLEHRRSLQAESGPCKLDVVRSAARSFVAEALVEPLELPVVCWQPELAAVPALPQSNRREVEALLPVSAER